MDDASSTSDPFDVTGKRISHYFVIRRIASGGMGEVYEAEDERLQRRVALKMLPPWSRFDETAIERFRREARAASSLNHPAICTIYEFDEFEGRPFIAMELVEGPSLQQVVASESMGPDRAAAIVANVAEGLAHAHARSITHRDIKPGNILLTDDGRAKIADFGLARITDATTITREDRTLGTVAYMSPEQARGEPAGPKSDVWSLGAVYYELLTGERPFDGEYASAVLYQIVNEDPGGLDLIRSRFGDRTADLVSACLQKQPETRPDASVLAGRGHPTATDPTGIAKPAARRRRPAAMIAGALIVALVLAGIFLFRPDPGIPTLAAASIAVLPPSASDLKAHPVLNGFVGAASEALENIAEERSLVRYVVPFDLVLREEVDSPAEALRHFGTEFVISTRFDETDRIEDPPTVVIALTSTETGDVRKERRITLRHDDLQTSFGDAVRAGLSLLGLPDSAHPQIVGPYAPTEPGAFEIYAQAMIMVEGQQTEQSLRTAIEMLERAAEISPDFAPIYAGLGKANLALYSHTKDPALLETAERQCDRAIEIDANVLDAYITLSRIHLATVRIGQAKRVLQLALDADPTSVEALLSLADLYASEEGSQAQAERTFKKAIRFDPGHWDSYRRFGRFYLDQSRFDDAITQFQHLVKLLPQNPRAYNNLAAAYFHADSLDRAFEYWEKALEIDPNDYFSTANLGGMYFYYGRYAEAARWFERALELNDANYVVWGNLGTAYLWSGSDRSKYVAAKEKAIELAEEALAANPRDDQARAKLAGYHAEMGDSAAARRYLADFGATPSRELPDETTFEIGTAYEELGDRETALTWIREALNRGYSTTELMRYPGLDSLRTDPQFIEMMQAIGRTPVEATQ